MNILYEINSIIAIIFTICYAYQLFYILVPVIFRKRIHRHKSEPKPLRKYAFVIAARNEESVISDLLRSIKSQDYPAQFIDTYVIADNCTDNTGKIAEAEGAKVVYRNNTSLVGKGYALDYFFAQINIHDYDGYFIFDADNVLSTNYVTEMNKVFSDENRIVTSCRNSKNYGDNWISAGYALWFLRESKFLNRSRYALGTSSAVSGTGFLFHNSIIADSGWKYHLLTEDIEFSVDQITKGNTIAYCDSAVFYDEQPFSFKQSCRQRLRWAKGYLQVFANYGIKMFGGIFGKNAFACFDMFMSIAPAAVLSILTIFINIIIAGVSLANGTVPVIDIVYPLCMPFVTSYALLFAIGLITVITEWNKIYCSTFRKILSLFTFPIFMYTYLPLTIAAFFLPVGWKPIKHSVSKSFESICNTK